MLSLKFFAELPGLKICKGLSSISFFYLPCLCGQRVAYRAAASGNNWFFKKGQVLTLLQKEAINTNNRVLINSTFQHTHAQKSQLGYPIIRLCGRRQLTLISVTFCALDTAHSFSCAAHSRAARRQNTSREMWLFVLTGGELGQRKRQKRKNSWKKLKKHKVNGLKNKKHFVFLSIFFSIIASFICLHPLTNHLLFKSALMRWLERCKKNGNHQDV